MPFTFSHPLAVVPLRRFCPKWLNFAALLIGSISPDFAYYARQFPVASYAHTVPGTFLVCLPSGLLVLAIFYGLRRSVCYMLPQPHRGALTPLAAARWQPGLRSSLVAIVSILIGAWTHTIWDSFTHSAGWAVQHVPLLGAPLMRLAGGQRLSVSYFLQQLSTVGAGVALGWLYLSWLRRQPARPLPGSDRWRYLLIVSLVVLSLALAAPAAWDLASRFDGFFAVRVFVFRMGVYSGAVFFQLLVVVALILHAVQASSSEEHPREDLP